MNCIIQYKDKSNDCFCNRLKECPGCNNKEKRITKEKCTVEPNGWCTCRTCGYSINI